MLLPANNNSIVQASLIIHGGGLVAFPTETVYGLGAHALMPKAVAKVFEAKNRPPTNPLIVHVHSIGQVYDLLASDLAPRTRYRIDKLSSLWPGPLSLVLPSSDKVPQTVTAASGTIAVRIPAHQVALDFLRECNVPIAAPSANPSGYVSPTCAEHVLDSLGDKVDLILDGGPCAVGIESTVLSLVANSPLILRPGAISKEELEALLDEEVAESPLGEKAETDAGASPGMLSEHYAPRTPIAFRDSLPNQTMQSKKLGLVSFVEEKKYYSGTEFEKVLSISSKCDAHEVAANLFAALREMDKLGLDYILIDRIEERGLGKAVMDRLYRATASTFR